jgi:ribonucleoside-diphosphate reductase subunit M2
MSKLRDDPKRHTVFPIAEHCMPIWTAYKLQVSKVWTPEEIDFRSDLRDWNTLEADEREFLLHVLAFFAISDSLVLENLVTNFCNELANIEVRAFYTFQAAMEMVHAETYSILLDLFCIEKEEKTRLFQAVETLPSVAAKAAYAQQWMNPSIPYEQRLVAFACVEGILFSGSFCAIYWLKHFKQKCPGLTLSNEFIARDEAQHLWFACFLFKDRLLPEQRPSTQRVYEIVRQCVGVAHIQN